MTWLDCVTAASHQLVRAGFGRDEACRDASVIARAVLGWDEGHWIVHQRAQATDQSARTIAALVARRASHEPVAYLTGTKEFYGRPFRVTRDVLIPRPETELVVDLAKVEVARLSRPGALTRVADVGTGTGCLAVTLALECGALAVLATDLSAEALDVARDNAAALDAARAVTFQQTSMLGGHTGFDLIVSNPPYVAEGERHTLAPDVADFEPALALFGGDDGLDVYRMLIPASWDALHPGGALVVEIGSTQGPAVTKLFEAAHWERTTLHHDLAGLARVLVARKPERSIIAP